MGFRFQRRLKLLPGIWVNLSKSGASLSAGVPGMTVNSRGIATAGIPGTGLSYRQNLSTRERRQAQRPKATSTQTLVNMLNECLGSGPLSIRDLLWHQQEIGLISILRTNDQTPRRVLEATALLETPDRPELHIRRGKGPAESAHRLQQVIDAIRTVTQFAEEVGIYKPEEEEEEED